MLFDLFEKSKPRKKTTDFKFVKNENVILSIKKGLPILIIEEWKCPNVINLRALQRNDYPRRR